MPLSSHMDLATIYRMVTWIAGKMLGSPENERTLKVGSPADLSILQKVTPTGDYPLRDADGFQWMAKTLIQAAHVIRSGVLM